jgi:hypothetical protein
VFWSFRPVSERRQRIHFQPQGDAFRRHCFPCSTASRQLYLGCTWLNLSPLRRFTSPFIRKNRGRKLCVSCFFLRSAALLLFFSHVRFVYSASFPVMVFFPLASSIILQMTVLFCLKFPPLCFWAAYFIVGRCHRHSIIGCIHGRAGCCEDEGKGSFSKFFSRSYSDFRQVTVDLHFGFAILFLYFTFRWTSKFTTQKKENVMFFVCHVCVV